MVKRWVLLAGMTALAGCTGTMQSVVRGTGQPVSFTYESGMMSDNYTAIIDGETFRGRAVMEGGTSTFGTGFGTGVASDGTIFTTQTQVFGDSYTGNFAATLLGNRGSTLRCAMRYADSSGVTAMGGVGQCRHSDGRMIDVVW